MKLGKITLWLHSSLLTGFGVLCPAVRRFLFWVSSEKEFKDRHGGNLSRGRFINVKVKVHPPDGRTGRLRKEQLGFYTEVLVSRKLGYVSLTPATLKAGETLVLDGQIEAVIFCRLQGHRLECCPWQSKGLVVQRLHPLGMCLTPLPQSCGISGAKAQVVETKEPPTVLDFPRVGGGFQGCRTSCAKTRKVPNKTGKDSHPKTLTLTPTPPAISSCSRQTTPCGSVTSRTHLGLACT
jgi:hypothetical protein